jgi:hypothetical protein
MLSDIDAKNRAADIEEGEIGEGSGAAATEEFGGEFGRRECLSLRSGQA